MIIIDSHGDSTVWGAEILSGKWGQSVNNVPALLQAQLGKRSKVNNKGISGVTIPQRMIGAYPASNTWASEMASSVADIITIRYGINDANQQWEDDFTFRYYLNQMISTAEQAGKLVVVETPNPINNPLYNRLCRLAEITRNVAASRGLAIVDHHAWVQSGLKQWSIGRYLPDGVHPSSELYSFMAKNLYTILNPIVYRLSLTKG